MITLNPYLVFNDNCEEAFIFYKQVFGGEILFMGRYKDVPAENRQLFSSPDDKIMHATLQINKETTLMGSDNAEAHQSSKSKFAHSFYLYISTETKAEAYRIFNELSARGNIIMPIAPTFWSTHYGMVTDQFGIQWKITYDPGEK